LYPDTKLPHYNINLSQWIKYFSQDVMNTKEGITYKGEYTKRTEISLGETPLTLEAWSIDLGFILVSFCLASNERDKYKL